MRRAVVIALLALSCFVPATAFAEDDDGGNERLVIKGPVLVDRGETSGDVLVGQGDVTIRGDVDGDVVVADGDVTIRGSVTGDVYTFNGTAILGRRATVGGDVFYAKGDPQIASGANVEGKVEKFDAGDFGGVGSLAYFAVWLAATISVLILGLLLLLLVPRAADAVAGTAKKSTLASFFVGLLVFILLPVLAIVCLLTILGIPLGVGLLLALVPIYALGYTAACFIVGRLIISKGARILAFVVGLVILRGLALIPFASSVIWFLVTVFGLGAIFMAILRARK